MRLRLLAVAAAVLAIPLVHANAAETATVEGNFVVPLVFPVLGDASWSDSWGACRSGCTRRHMGQDLMAPKMRPLIAACDGKVVSLKREETVGSGNHMSIACSGKAAGWSVNYVHVNNDNPGTDDGMGTASYAFVPGMRSGKPVFAGEQVGWNGDSGNAESTAPHLHFELRKGSDGWGSPAVNAAPSLRVATKLAHIHTSGLHTDGTLVAAGASVYLLEDGKRRLIGSKALLDANGWRLEQVVRIQWSELAYYPAGQPVTAPTGRFVREVGIPTVWYVEDNVRHAVPDPATLASYGVRAAAVTVVPLGTIVPLIPVELPVEIPVLGDILPSPAPTPDPSPSPSPSPTDEPDPIELGTPLVIRDGTVFAPGNGHRYIVENGKRRDIHPMMWQIYGMSRLPVLVTSELVARRTPAGPPLADGQSSSTCSWRDDNCRPART